MKKEALEKYGILMSYLQYENSMYWERGNFFLVSSTALFAIVATNIPALDPTTPIYQVVALMVMSIAGLYLNILWHQSLISGEFWVGHWHELLKKLEPEAFGRMKVIREFESSSTKRISARSIPRKSLFLFYILWSLLLLYSIAIIVFRLLAITI